MSVTQKPPDLNQAPFWMGKSATSLLARVTTTTGAPVPGGWAHRHLAKTGPDCLTTAAFLGIPEVITVGVGAAMTPEQTNRLSAFGGRVLGPGGAVEGSRSMGLGAVAAGGGATLNHRLMECDPSRVENQIHPMRKSPRKLRWLIPGRVKSG